MIDIRRNSLFSFILWLLFFLELIVRNIGTNSWAPGLLVGLTEYFELEMTQILNRNPGNPTIRETGRNRVQLKFLPRGSKPMKIICDIVLTF